MLGIIIQARLGSSRLPNKILKSFSDSTLLMYQIKRLQKMGYPIIVATTDSPKDDELVDYLKINNIDYYRGGEHDVLKRYIDTANKFKLDTIVRVCSDSPFIDLSYLKTLIEEAKKDQNWDYYSFSYQNKPTVLSYFGVFAELTTLQSLKKLYENFDEKSYKEHVTYGLYSNPESFNIRLIPKDEELEVYDGMRLTVDTPIDYENIMKVENIHRNNPDQDFLSLASEISKDKNLIKRMKNENIANTK